MNSTESQKDRELSTDVSIIIPTFNATNDLLCAIKSCFSCEEDINIELIIIEDGSPNPSIDILKTQYREILNSVSFPRIIYLEQLNTGAYKTRIKATKLASGKYIKFLDQDDVLIQGVLKEEVSFAEGNNSEIVLTNWYVENDRDESMNIDSSLTEHYAPIYDSPIDDFLKVGGVYTAAALYKRECFTSITAIECDIKKVDDWLIFDSVNNSV